MSRQSDWTRGGWRVVVTLLLVVGLGAPLLNVDPAAAQALLPATATAAPESTVLYHQIDLDRESAQWQQAEDLLARVGVPNAIDMLEAEILATESRGAEITRGDLAALLGGEMAIVVTPPAVEHFMAMMAMMEQMGGRHGDMEAMPGMDGTPMPHDQGMMGTPIAMGPGMGGPSGLAAVLLPGDIETAWDYVQKQFESVALASNVAVQTEEHNGAELLVVEGVMRHGDMGKDDWMGGYPLNAEHGLVAARAGAFIVTGPTREDVTAIVDVIQGEEPSLAESAEAQRVRAQLPAGLLSFTYVDGPALLETVGQEMLEAWVNAFPGASLGEAQAYQGVGIGAQPFGFQLDTIAIPAEGATLPQAQVENNPDILATAEQAPGNTFLFNAGALPEDAFAGLAYAIASAVNAATAGEEWDGGPMMTTPPTAEEVQAEIEEAAATLGFNPQTDLIDLLGDDFIVFATLPNFMMGGFAWDAVAAVTTADPAALAETAEKIAAHIERMGEAIEVTTRQVDGDTVYVVGAPEMDGAPELEFGVVDGQVVIGTGTGIEDLVGDPADSLAADAQFQEVMAVLPSEAYQVGYVDLNQLVDVVVALMAMGQDTAATPVAAGAGTPENIRALGSVAYQEGEMAGSTAVLYIAE